MVVRVLYGIILFSGAKQFHSLARKIIPGTWDICHHSKILFNVEIEENFCYRMTVRLMQNLFVKSWTPIFVFIGTLSHLSVGNKRS